MNRRSAGNNKRGRWPDQRQKQTGISLLESLIAIVVGLLVLAGVLKFISQTIEANTSLLKITRLEQDLRTLMDIMLQDMRRAGSFPEAVADLGNIPRYKMDQPALPQIDGQPLIQAQAGSAMTYAYREADGKLVSGRFTFDAKAGSVLMHTGTASAPETISDPGFMTVSALTFTPEIAAVRAGGVDMVLPSVKIHLVAHLKSDPSLERALEGRVTWRNPLVVP